MFCKPLLNHCPRFYRVLLQTWAECWGLWGLCQSSRLAKLYWCHGSGPRVTTTKACALMGAVILTLTGAVILALMGAVILTLVGAVILALMSVVILTLMGAVVLALMVAVIVTLIVLSSTAPQDPTHTAGDEEEGKPKVEYTVMTELQRLRCMIDTITDATNLAPVGSQVANAHDDIIVNPLFSGVSYPDKLESFYHQHQGPGGAPS